MARTGSWDRLLHLVRERPTTLVFLDEAALPVVGTVAAVAEIRRRFPSVGVVLVARPASDPYKLLHLGRAGVDRLILLRVDDLEREGGEGAAKALVHGTEALVTRAVSPYLPPRVLSAVRMALEGVQRRWTTGRLAEALALSRPHLSVCLKDAGLPSAGHLLVWSRLLHAGRWLTDPGRTAESVSRQLEYSSGAAFRRALRSYVGASPTEVTAYGGLAFVLDRFLVRCNLDSHRRDGRSVA
ncbi:MAG TPA: AraC family transcriptional regulator [Longimicrobiales bacterium]|nr:AraC family transcriptional regulator [Longimicrobiales bacterium]